LAAAGASFQSARGLAQSKTWRRLERFLGSLQFKKLEIAKNQGRGFCPRPLCMSFQIIYR
jgi:hypothetical protein